MRAERSTQAKKLKKTVAEVATRLEGFTVVEPLTGANVSTQYVSVVGYDSLLSRQPEGIKIEIGLREPLLTPAFDGAARTALLDPVSGRPMVPPLAVRCISRMEAFAEKFRAALSRREVAIRDFYDIDYAVRRLNLRPQDAALVELVRQKLTVPGNEPADVSEARLAMLRRQLDAQLKPVLRDRDFAEFDLERAFRTVAQLAGKTR